MRSFLILIMTCMVAGRECHAEEFNYDESKVPKFDLPDPLKFVDGKSVDSAKQWPLRRAEILSLFESEVYGRAPGSPTRVSSRIVAAGSTLGGRASWRQVRLTITTEHGTCHLDLLLVVPRNADAPVPAFLGLNFNGNQTVIDDPKVPLTRNWVRNSAGVVDNRATDESRGTQSGRWDLATIIGAGYALATMYCGDIDPDFHDGFKNGVHPLFSRDGQSEPAADEWGTISAWAWGLSRALDYLTLDQSIDHRRVAVIGHSRLGKTSLWAGAQDERFGMVISNNSGCGGAALSRRRFGETVKRINTAFPHWFCGNFKKYNDNEKAIPVDQHLLMALIAPRPLYVASAVEDQWADPRGEYLSAYFASPVYKLLGKSGFTSESLPSVDTPISATIGYHVRSGGHDVTRYDWEQYVRFAEKHFQSVGN